MSSGKPVKRWQDIISTMKEDCQKFGNGIRSSIQKRWFFSSPKNTDAVSKFDFKNVHDTLFDRKEAEENYIMALEQPKDHTRQDLAVAKAQSDFLSASERDYTLRHRTRIRRMAHESVARVHTGSSRGSLTSNLEFYLQQQLQRIKG